MENFDLNTHPLDAGTHSIDASAGTGKTFSLVGLILRLVVIEDLRIPQILAVTFTKKATGELADRLRQKLATAVKWLDKEYPKIPDDSQFAHWHALIEENPSRRDKFLRNALIALAEADSAAVFTIHGFCQRVLSECAFESGLPLELDMETAGSAFTRTAVRDFLREIAAPLLAESDTDREVAHFILDELKVNEAWLTDLAKHLSAGARVKWCDLNGTFTDGANAVNELRAFYVERNSVLKRYAAGSESDKIKHLSGTLAQLIRSIPEKSTAKGDKKASASNHSDAKKSLRDFVALAFEATFAKKLAAIKSEARALTFDDLISKTAESVKSPEFKARIGERYKIALIDEFQDTDSKQTAIFCEAFEGKPLVFIGDPKQSIYRFRGADLKAYEDAVKSVKPDYRRKLGFNYRSTPAMIRAANALFERNIESGKAGLFDPLPTPEKQEASAPIFLPVDPGATNAEKIPVFCASGKTLPALTLVWGEAAADTPLTARQAELRFASDIAGRIRDLLSTHQLGDKKLRANDIAVLVRTGKQGALIQTKLRQAGIHATRTAGSVFQGEAASALRRVLIALLSGGRSKSMLAALAGPIFAYTATDLARIESQPDSPEYQELAELFAAAAKTWRASGVAAAITELLNKKELPKTLLLRADGERLLVDLRQLMELAHTEEKSAHHSPESLLTWLSSAIREANRKGDMPGDAERQRLESDADCVSILTMHAAKGLEFPVVFVPYAWKFDTGGRYAPKFVTGHADGGRAVAVDGNHPELENQESAEQLSEQARLLYVAVTRAQSACFVYSGLIAKKGAGKSTKWAQGIWNTPLGQCAPMSDYDIQSWIKGAETVRTSVSNRKDWATFVDAHKGYIRILDCSKRTATAVPHSLISDLSSPISAPPPAARVFSASIDDAKISASYSGLTRALGDAHAAPKLPPDSDSHRHDETLSAALPVAPKAPVANAPDSIFTFPRGATVGDAVHGLLEDHDFTREIAVETVAAALRTNGLDATRWAGVLAERINAWLATPLTDATGATFALRDIPAADRLPEMGFDLTARLRDGKALSVALAGARTPPLPDSLLRDLNTAKLPKLDGWLTGFIDLIFRRDGRYYILDWKTNHLGHAIDAYTPDAIDRAMEEHRYHLQYHFYLVALDAHLRACLSDYAPEIHLGGVYYLFVRGLDPAQSGYGVFRATAEPTVIAALADALSQSEK